MPDIFISGVPFIAVGHRDGGFARAPGLFAFSRRDLNGGHTVLHFEMAALISQRAAPSHPRWAWALTQGMDSLLIHMFGRPAAAPERQEAFDTVLWSPEAQIVFLDADLADPGPEIDIASSITSALEARRSR
ncbi:MAG: hypothetical protein V4759_03095 [Pseudomonadota bacterium]